MTTQVVDRLVRAGVSKGLVEELRSRHRPGKAYFTADGRAARGQEAVDAAAAGRSVDVCSCDQGSGCDVMRLLLEAGR